MSPQVFAAVAAMTILFATPAFADGNVASVDRQKLVQDAPQVKASGTLVKQEFAPREKAIEQQRKQVADLHKVYGALGPGANALERASAGGKLVNAQKKLGKLESQYASGLALRRHQLRTNFNDVLEKDIRAYAEAHGITLVVGDGVVYAGAATDITDAILAMLKRDYRKARAAAGKGK